MTYRRLAVLLTFCLCACAGRPLAGAAKAAGPRISDHPERYIVAGIDNENPTPAGHAGSSPKGYDSLTIYGPSSRAVKLLRDVERDYGLREVSAWPIAPLHMHCAVLELPTNADRASVVAALTQDRRVRIAEPLQTFTTQTDIGYNDPYVGLQRGFQQMDVPEAHAWSRGEGIRIAIIDTGADTLHPDLRGAIVQIENFVDSDAEQFRRDRHGTELAGIIAAVANNHEGIVGIAPGARLLVLKACWQEHDDADAARCNSFTLAQSLTAAFDAHAQIVNLSLAGPADPLLRELLREGLRRGIIFIGAAPSGMEGRDNFLAVDGVIEVANGGSQGDAGTPLHAPGQEVLTLFPGGRYDFASGTSLATAHVTGTVALLLRKNARLTAAEVYRLLRETTLHVADGDSINACAAIASLMGHGQCSHQNGNRVAKH
ncbi:MAG: S8 family serine peptidase [Steroidobacteraceae bacterium]